MFIAIDGVDSSGKQTHTQMLAERLKNEGYNVKLLTFPNYESPASEPVKMYLSGSFGKKPGDVSPYVASTFFAVDRYASFKTDWYKDYKDSDTIIISDRYTSSNMIHQASKIKDRNDADKFLDWLFQFEFDIFELPKPDITFFLDMPTEYAISLMKDRENKFTHSDNKDIHESDADYLKKSYDNACYVAKKFKWEHISCVSNGIIRNIPEINDEIFEKAIKIIKSGKNNV